MSFIDAFTDKVWGLPDMVVYSPNAYFFAAANYFKHIGVFCLAIFNAVPICIHTSRSLFGNMFHHLIYIG